MRKALQLFMRAVAAEALQSFCGRTEEQVADVADCFSEDKDPRAYGIQRLRIQHRERLHLSFTLKLSTAP